ncbi:hypothetical protein SAMN05660350_04897 [Geodermatophilus obscurus]|uniref:Uncharacterized protein n=1 Tax=Geodermatophilus obscurus TaxID=1861 RepID=A0A1M7V148_9ACTN|nr:hypothetical protein SAMN05660350_04897 [Geodermatophilus obscurus]
MSEPTPPPPETPVDKEVDLEKMHSLLARLRALPPERIDTLIWTSNKAPEMPPKPKSEWSDSFSDWFW